MIILYAALSLIILVAIGLARSQRLMNTLSIIHALGILAITGYLLATLTFPQYYLADQYFFIDHLGAFEILIAGTIFLFASIYAGGYVRILVDSGELKQTNLKLFYVSLNALLFIVTFSFLANNLAVFWIFAELTTIVSAMLIALLYAWDNIDAALKYIFIASAAMLFSFIGLIFLFSLTQNALGAGTVNWNTLVTNASLLSPNLLTISFVFSFIGFAAKAGVVPFHTWLPDAHSKAPSAVSAILSAVLLNVGVYGIIRLFAIVKHTSAVANITLFIILFGVVSIMVAAFHMLQQRNLKKIIAFSSIENIGLILVGVAIGTPLMLFWTLYYTLAHSLTKAVLFFSAGILHKQYESNTQPYMKNVFRLQPVASVGIILGVVSIIGMPPFIVFLAKLPLLQGVATYSPWLLFIILLFITIAAASLVLFLARIFSNVTEVENVETEVFTVPRGMTLTIVSLLVMILILGVFFPAYLQNMLSTIALELHW